MQKLKILLTGVAMEHTHIYVNSEISFDIDLGWPGIVRRDNDY